MAIVSSKHEGYSAMYKANLATMEIGEKLVSIPGYDVGTAIPNEDRDGIVGYTYATDRVRRKFTDERLATVQKFLAEDFGEGNAVIVSSDDGDKRLIVSMASQIGRASCRERVCQYV